MRKILWAIMLCAVLVVPCAARMTTVVVGGSVASSAPQNYVRYITENTADFNGITYVACGSTDGCSWTGVADTQLDQAHPTWNYGSTTTLSNSTYDASNWAMPLIKFTGLSNIPSGATVTSVTFGWYIDSRSHAQTYDNNIRRLLRDWTVGTQNGAVATNDSPNSTTWNNYSGSSAWGTAGAQADTDRSSTVSGVISLSAAPTWSTVTDTSGQLLADVQAWVSGTYSNYGWWTLYSGTPNQSRYYIIRSSNHATTSTRPYLKVEYTY